MRLGTWILLEDTLKTNPRSSQKGESSYKTAIVLVIFRPPQYMYSVRRSFWWNFYGSAERRSSFCDHFYGRGAAERVVTGDFYERAKMFTFTSIARRAQN